MDIIYLEILLGGIDIKGNYTNVLNFCETTTHTFRVIPTLEGKYLITNEIAVVQKIMIYFFIHEQNNFGRTLYVPRKSFSQCFFHFFGCMQKNPYSQLSRESVFS